MHLLVILCLVFHFAESLEIADNVKHYKGLVNRLNEYNPQANDVEQLITDMLYDSVRSTKCFALICDRMNCNLFTSKMFRKFKMHVTYFMIQIDESEDLLSPYPATQACLQQIELEKCKFYIVLIANAIQVARFLRFGDRYRLLNTRANFILLYDIRLFHSELHYVWSRLVNVIFVREYGGTGRTKTGVAVPPWFDLSTVPFPTPIRGVLIPRRVDIWRKGHFRLGVNLYRDKTSDLHNQTLNVVTFPHIPAVVKTTTASFANVTHSTNVFLYSGVEVQILKTLSEQMNFNTHIYEPPNADREKWGHKRDGKVTGVLGEMVKYRAEIALADLYYSPDHLELMDLSIPYNTECLTFLTPESTTDNSWLTLVLPFKLYMWLTVILVLFAVGFILYSLAKFERHLYATLNTKTCTIVEEKLKSVDHIRPLLNSPFKYLEFRKHTVQVVDDQNEPSGLHLFEQPFNSWLYTYSMLLLVSLPKVPDGWSLRMIVGWYFLYCTLVVVSYKASMTAILTNPAPKITIDSLPELERSGLACGGWGDNRAFFLTSRDEAGQRIGARFENINESGAAIERVASGQFAYYENVYYLKAASVDRQMQIEKMASHTNDSVRRRDNKNLHIMSHCVINMPVSLGLQKNSPIKPKVDVFIRRVIEGGFVTKWLDDAMQPTLNSEIYSGPAQSLALMNLGKLYCGFVALLIGYAISFAALALELAYWHCIFVKHPHFDKYSKQINISVTK